MNCPRCAAPIDEDKTTCPACGATAAISSHTPTGTAPQGTKNRPSEERNQARFVPGAVIAGRYRIVALLGRGGMGEVYRADDLKLGQVVALKFLPEALQNDRDRLERLIGEVRVARQVTHPNVCRVHDIDEVNGVHFLSMEYVDGEDLASLLRRIGRLPQAKSLEIARQLAAGLAAAHEKGVLHRDLKPENVMIDGRGQVRITDFGLAGLAGTFADSEVRSGTPAYMSPEQLAGESVTVKSDLYALGLVLYEAFTGKKAYSGRNAAELAKQRQQDPLPPTRVVEDLDPSVERVILSSLDRDPARRPASALSVIAALPGGDPLAAAMAAGETPSPEMVAASGRSTGLRPALAWAAMLAIVVGLAVHVVTWPGETLPHYAPLEKPPAVLQDRARDILAGLDPDSHVADETSGFSADRELLKYVAGRDHSRERWEMLRKAWPPAYGYWYRRSPLPLIALAPLGTASPTDPPPILPGMAGVWLDPRGRLISLYRVPSTTETQTESTTSDAPWPALFAAAHIDAADLTPTEPHSIPPVYADMRAAWELSTRRAELGRTRIEAAALRGRPVYFRVIAPWMPPDGAPPNRGLRQERVPIVISMIVTALVFGGGALLARKNLRAGRGDRRGALRLAVFVSGLTAVTRLFGAHHNATLEGEFRILMRAASASLFVATIMWCLYIAIEPYARRHWPTGLISWTRLLAGQANDPLVGGDLLLGSLIGVSLAIMSTASSFLIDALGIPPGPPERLTVDGLLGTGQFVSEFSGISISTLTTAISLSVLMLLLRTLLRWSWPGAAVFTGLIGVEFFFTSLTDTLDSSSAVAIGAFGIVLALTLWFFHFRLGLLAFATALYVDNALNALPPASDTSSWYASAAAVWLLLTVTPALFGLRSTLAGRPKRI